MKLCLVIQNIEVDVLYITSNLSYHKDVKTRMFTYPPVYLLIFISKSQKYGKIIETVLDIILWKLFIFLEPNLGVFSHHTRFILGFSSGSDGEESAMQKIGVWSLGWEDALEKGMPTHSSVLAWRISWTEESGGQQSMGSQSQTHLSNFHCHLSHIHNSNWLIFF